MFDFFKRKSPQSASTESGMPPLFFKDGAAALEYVCEYMECPLQEGSFLPALVLDPRESVGAADAIQTQKDGNQIAMLRVASSDGGFIVFASTSGPKGPKLQPGDFVAWCAGKHSADVAVSTGAKDKRSGWVGLIVGTLKPEHRDGHWVYDVRFVPDMDRAPLENILPSFIPVILERGVPGYEGVQITVPGEKRLSRMEIRSLLVASAYLGIQEHAGNRNFDFDRVRQILTRSLLEFNDLSPEEKAFSLQLVDCFYSYKIIRAEHSFDDWVCEALWAQFQSIQYVYPSAMADAVSFALTINKTLDEFSLEY